MISLTFLVHCLLLMVSVVQSVEVVKAQENIGVSGADTTIIHQNILTLLPPQQSQPPPPDCTSNDSKNNTSSHRFECWLYKLEIPLPKQSFEKDYVEFDLKDLECTQFQVSSLSSEYTPSNQKRKYPSLQLQADNLAATCRGRYHLTGGISGKVNVQLSAQSPGLEWNLQVTNTTIYDKSIPADDILSIPATIQTQQCDTHLSVTKVSFTGSISAHLIDLFSKSIEHYINDALKGQICPLLSQNLDPLVTNYIQQFDEWAKRHLKQGDEDENATAASVSSLRRQLLLPVEDPEGSSSPSSAFRSLTFQHDDDKNSTPTIISDPNNLPVVRYWIDLANSVFRRYLNAGFLFQDWVPQPCDEHQCGFLFRGISGLFHHYTHGRIRVARPKLLQHLRIENLPLNSTLTLHMNNLIIEGLDQMDDFQVFAGRDMETTLQSPGWNVSVEVSLELDRPGSDDPLQEQFLLQVNATDISAVATSLLHVQHWDTLSMYQVVEALQNIALNQNRTQSIACLARTIQRLEISDVLIDLVLQHVSISPIGDGGHQLEKDLDEVINSVTALFLNEYSEMVQLLLKAVIRGPITFRLNQYLTSLIHRFQQDHVEGKEEEDVCPSIPDTTKPHWIDFLQVKFLKTMNAFLNHQHVLSTLNDYLECIGIVILHHSVIDSVEGEEELQKRHHKKKSGLSLVIRDAEIQEMGSLSSLHVLDPTLEDDTSYLETSLALGSSAEVFPRAFVSLEVLYPKYEFRSVVNATLYTRDLELLLGTRINYDLRQLTNITVLDLLERAQCLAVPAAELRLLENSHFTGGVGLNLSGIVNEDIVISIDSSKDYPTVEQVWNDSTAVAFQVTRSFLNRALEALVVRSTALCDQVDVTQSKESKAHSTHLVGLICFGLFVVLGQAGLYLLFTMRGRKSQSNDDGMWR